MTDARPHVGPEPFEGTIGRTYQESTPWWPEERAGRRRPNVVIVLLDDTGFAHLGCFGSTIDTPNMDRLAAGGLRYTNFHTTALCSPTRASLLTGRNHHSVGMRAVSNFDSGFPNMRGYVTRHAATLAEMLKPHGYATFAIGKWHLLPMSQGSQAGPHEHWPLQRGFDRYYGFLQGETDQFYPELTHDNHHIEPPRTPEEGYHLSEDLVDHAIQFVRDSKSILPERPFLTYLAFGATHAPHQAPRAYIEKYRGRFDAGWDSIRQEWFQRQQAMGIVPPGTVLPPRNPGVEPWESLSANQRQFALRLQEAFAGFLDHTDAQLGRFVDFLDGLGELDDTIFVLLSDNGASREGGADGMLDGFRYFNGLTEDVDAVVGRLNDIGGPHSHPNYPWGWAQAGNTPLKWYKSYTYGGGVRDPLIVHWPARIADGGAVRDQFHHVTDVVPTILEVLDIEPPATAAGFDQMPIHGTSMAYTFAAPDEPTRKGVQYFEMYGHRGIWKDGWKAVAQHAKGTSWDDDEWELYRVADDYSESRNLAAERPDVLGDLVDEWWVEAERNGVLPLDDRTTELFSTPRRSGTPHTGHVYVYYPPVTHVPSDAAPRLSGKRPWTVTVEVDRDGADGTAGEGVLVARGSHNLGFVFYVQAGRLVFDYNVFSTHYRIESAPLSGTPGTLAAHYSPRGAGADVTLLADGQVVGQGFAEESVRMMGSTGMDIGRDALSPVSDDYAAPFEFQGGIRRVTFELLPIAAAAEQREAQETARVDLARE